jgi:RND family efflux transporter MFP subunit
MSCVSKEQKSQVEAKLVRVAKVEVSKGETEREFTFISKPFKEANLSFRVGGQIAQLDIQSGDFFSKGDVIARLDKRDYIIRKDKAAVKYLQSKAEFKRIQALFLKKNVSASYFDKAELDMLLSKAAYDTAFNQLKDTEIKAPFNGYVQTIHKDCYQDVRASEPILSFINLDKIKIEAYIPEEIAIRANTIEQTNISFDAFPKNTFSADIINVSKGACKNNISFLLTASLDNKANSFNLLGGMSGTITFSLPIINSQHTSIIPQKAVCNNPSKGTYVWLLDKKNNTVKSVPVSLGEVQSGNKIEIIEGLNANDLIVTTGHSLLSDNDIVSI